MIEANWLIFIAALIIGIIVAWWLFARGSKGVVRDRRPDVLDEGAAPAKRNQALIDAPPAATFTPPAAGTMAGIGEIVSVAAKDEVAESRPEEDLREAAEAREEAREEARREAEDGLPDPLHKPAAVEAPVPVPPKAPAPAPDTVTAPDSAPAPAPEPATVPTPTGQADDLRRIKGIGPKLATLLQQLGVTSYAQIAGWTDADIDALDAKLGAFAGRPRRDNWVEQARLLSSGDTGGYEAKFGKL